MEEPADGDHGPNEVDESVGADVVAGGVNKSIPLAGDEAADAEQSLVRLQCAAEQSHKVTDVVGAAFVDDEDNNGDEELENTACKDSEPLDVAHAADCGLGGIALDAVVVGEFVGVAEVAVDGRKDGRHDVADAGESSDNGKGVVAVDAAAMDVAADGAVAGGVAAVHG